VICTSVHGLPRHRLATVTVLWIGGAALIPRGGRGAGNGVAARSQLYKDLTPTDDPLLLYAGFFGKKTRGVGPDSKKTRRFRNLKFRKLRLLSVVGLTGSEDWENHGGRRVGRSTTEPGLAQGAQDLRLRLQPAGWYTVHSLHSLAARCQWLAALGTPLGTLE
jgi:hypothetical protein